MSDVDVYYYDILDFFLEFFWNECFMLEMLVKI